jgi:hypothetical protein
MDGGSVCMVSFLVILVFDHRRGFIRNITSNTWTYMLLAPEQLDASGFFFFDFFSNQHAASKWPLLKQLIYLF